MIDAIPASQLPPELLGRPRSEMQQISISRLRQNKPVVYQLAPGDVMGVYIQNVLGSEEESPPVHFPEAGDQIPAVGFPIPVREDGTLALPLIRPIRVDGITLPEAEQAIRNAYAAAEINADNIIVTLMRRREYRVTVIREETGGKEGVSKRGTGETIDLPAYENDVLHALNESGGLPGLDARNEIYVIRGNHQDGVERDRLIAALQSCREPCSCPPCIPDHPSIVRIPIRFYPENFPEFTEEDIILESGDVVYIPARDADKFYTGGALPGGEYLLPRDYDIDVLGAIAIAGGSLGNGTIGISGLGRGSRQGGAKAPSDLIVLRNLPCGGQIAIRVDLNRALTDPRERILVQPGDTLILKYTLAEELFNTAINLFQINYLIR